MIFTDSALPDPTEEGAPPRESGGQAAREPLSERSFAAQLCRERKRAERSGRKIVLMLVEAKKCIPEPKQNESLTALLRALSRLMRETDIVGWHRKQAVAGVILTEFGIGEIPPALENVRLRISAVLRSILSPAELNALHITFHVFPENWDIESRDYAIDPMLHPELPGVDGKHCARSTLKRVVDIAGSLFALLALWPVFVLLAIAVRLTSSGPAFYRQERIGQFGRVFTMYKFRSMQFRAESEIHERYVRQFIRGAAQDATTEGIYKLKNDPRVTALGKFLRKSSLDEIPQFFNVLRGDMSLVGPRPPLPYEIRSYDAWHRRRILEAKPGLTGLWQVSGRSKTQFSDMVRLDLRYAQAQSVWLDISLLFKTIRVVIFDEGAC